MDIIDSDTNGSERSDSGSSYSDINDSDISERSDNNSIDSEWSDIYSTESDSNDGEIKGGGSFFSDISDSDSSDSDSSDSDNVDIDSDSESDCLTKTVGHHGRQTKHWDIDPPFFLSDGLAIQPQVCNSEGDIESDSVLNQDITNLHTNVA